MRPLKAYFHGETKHLVNGHVVQDTEVNTEYNGKILHVDERVNDTFKHFTIDDKHLKKILNKKTSKKNLLDRLKTEYGKTRVVKRHKHKTMKKHKHKRNKNKRPTHKNKNKNNTKRK